MILDCNGVLVALDQHAADERVQLEELRARLLAAATASTGTADRHPAGAPGVAGSHPGAGRGSDAQPPSEARMLRSVRLPRGADCLLSQAEQHLYEAYQEQADRCAMVSLTHWNLTLQGL